MVLSKGEGMINHPHKYFKNMNEPVRSNTIEKAKKKFSRGVGCSRHMVKNRAQRKMTNIGTISEIMKVAYQRYLQF